MLKKLLYIIPFICLNASAHPSYGLVVTGETELIFCDVLHNAGTVWRLDKSGGLSKILTGEHSHFIFLDHEGNIWGTNHEYLPATHNNRNTLWKLTPDQCKEVIIGPTENPREFSGVNFVIDGKGNIYFDHDNSIYVREKETPARLLLFYQFERIMSLQLDRSGNIYVVDNNIDSGTIFKITPEKDIRIIANNLREIPPPNPPLPNPLHNMLYASFIDSLGNVYVANSGSRRITLIKNDKSVEHIYHSDEPWYPVAYYQKDRIGYIMETGFIPGKGNIGPRIIKVESGRESVLINVDEASFKN